MRNDGWVLLRTSWSSTVDTSEDEVLNAIIDGGINKRLCSVGQLAKASQISGKQDLSIYFEVRWPSLNKIGAECREHFQ